MMEFERLAISDVVLVKPKIHGDARGLLMETWRADLFEAAGVEAAFVQDNHSRSNQWTLRGLHYQVKQPQGKLVRVTRGEVFDVAVDMRRSSATYGHWVGARLSDANGHMLWIPAGFAHGFLVLSETADFVYKCTDYYAPTHERTLLWNDQRISIEWPIPAGVEPLLSAKDRAGQAFAAAEPCG
jgi:dTDP-4-dehydrorhamnose 3,5-epimerase